MKFNNIAKRIAAAGLAAGLVLTTSVVSMAATTYTPVAGTSCNFNKYLIMDAGDSVPNATFSFTVAPGTARSADTSDNAVMQVLQGVGTPTIADVTFASTDATATAAGTNIDVARAASARANGLTAANGVELESGEKYATKQATVASAASHLMSPAFIAISSPKQPAPIMQQPASCMTMTQTVYLMSM